MTKQITIVSPASGDWEALYVDGKLVEEGHSLQLRDVFKALGIEAEFREVKEPQDVDGVVDFTPLLEDVKFTPYEDEDEDS